FGDCILARVPDGLKIRHMLVDFGRAPGKGGTTAAFPKIAEDIKSFCGGRLDLLVMTHEHLDHIEGFYHQRHVFDAIKVDHVWMSLPSHPKYYERFPNARPLRAFRTAADQLLKDSVRNSIQLAP